jgi:hypothetical protein
MYHLLRQRGVSVEAIGCALAPRTAYEATYEGHRAARKLGTSQLGRSNGRGSARSPAPLAAQGSSSR